MSSTKINATITAVGGYVPPTILNNTVIAKMVDTTEDWILKRTGIEERRISIKKEECTSDLASFALNDLLSKYEVESSEIDGVILATTTPDNMLAPTCSKVCEKSNLTNAFALDVNVACSGFLYALTIGSSMIESGRYKKIILIGADKMSSIVDYRDRSTCILFGDGAGAVLLEATDKDEGVMQSILRSDGSGTEHLLVPAGGSKYPTNAESLISGKHFVKQDGGYVFKKAVESMAGVCKDLLAKNYISRHCIDWLVPHQANIRIIKAVSEMIDIDFDKVKVNIQKYGNTTSATLPLCLWDFKDDFKNGDRILLTSFGAGFTWGATFLKWGAMRKVLK